MKQIITHGKTEIHRRDCFFCGCDFTYQDADIEYKPDVEQVRGTGLKPVKLVTCPECGRSNIIYNPNKMKEEEEDG